MLEPRSTERTLPPMAPLSASFPGGEETATIQSRFGEIVIDAGKAVLFQHGLLGLPDKLRFVLAQFPSAKMKQFMLLQSLDEPALSFITLPVALDNPIVARADILEVCQEMQIAEGNLGLLLIVSVHRTPGQVKLSVNARAPVFIDTDRRLGAQYVFQHDRYDVQHML